MEKELIVTKEMAAKAILFGACRVPKVGNRISQFATSDLIWAERMLPIAGFKSELPLWALSGDGSGYGYGSGDGSGYGYGSGDGSGDGYGDGDGSGDGYGYGSGDGSKYAELPSLLNA